MTIPIYLSSPPYRACEEDQQKCIECDRPAKVRGVCGRCYERHRAAGTVSELPARKRYRHTFEACEVCDEVTALAGHGWDARTILAAIGRGAEHVLRHLRNVGHPHADMFVTLASQAHRQRKDRP